MPAPRGALPYDLPYAYTAGLNSAPCHAEYTPLLMLLLLPILLLVYRTTQIYIGCIS